MPRSSSRRSFLQQTGAAAIAGTAALAVARSAHAAGSDVIKVGLIGCGGRGSGAAVQALAADPQTKLVSMGDVFADALEKSLGHLKRHEGVGPRVEVTPERCFVGFNAYQQVIDSGVDVVLLAAPPHFRPQHLKAAIDAGKHVFAEKPIAVDAPGVQKVLAACDEARKKNLAVTSGLCWRYEFGARAAIQQVHDGAVGEIVAIQATYNTAGRPKWPMLARESGWSDMEWQLRNWYWFNWLSGDHIVEQAVHSVDKAAWALRDEPPVSAVSLGGNQCRTQADSGNIYDHHAVTYDYPGGVKVYFACRQQPGTSGDVSVQVMGTKGICYVDAKRPRIETRQGQTIWEFTGKKNVMHQTEHDEMYAALRSGKLINDGKFMSYSTMLAILGRMASYTGQTIKWDAAMASKEDLTPPRYEWGSLDAAPLPMPGASRLV